LAKRSTQPSFKLSDKPGGHNIADVIGECVRGEDGTWRYRSHLLQPVFVGSDIPLALSIDTQILVEPAERTTDTSHRAW
jgi:hypothetical protein